jgi:peptide/nickel transport system ATP-binding protein
MTGAPLLEVAGLVRDYVLPRPHPFAPAPRLRVLHGIDLVLPERGSLGIVGESGSGKSTLARTVLALERPQAGSVRLRGRDLFALSRAELRAARRDIQAVFQDPYGSLDPRQRVGRIVAEPIAALERDTPAAARRERVAAMLEAVGLPAASAAKYPHEFSGGQRQRIAIARALVTRPALIVADEPVSALDVSVQAQVLALMHDLQTRLGLGWLFISHDLGVVRAITARVAVLYRGRVVEEGPTGAVFDAPRHPYTQALIAAVPRIGGGRRRRGPAAEAPVPARGCAYAPRCPLAVARCATEPPELRGDATRKAACHHAG